MRDNITLYHGDCLEIMPQLARQGIKVDMILCDLPYGVTNHKDDKPLSFDKLWESYNAIISDNGVIVLFAQGQFYVDLVNSNRKMFKYDLVWDKQLSTGFLNASRMPLRRHESIAVFYKKATILKRVLESQITIREQNTKQMHRPIRITEFISRLTQN